ncbi:MAG: hypothetical protein ABH849_02945 [Nanoarchaeota archaeon]
MRNNKNKSNKVFIFLAIVILVSLIFLLFFPSIVLATPPAEFQIKVEIFLSKVPSLGETTEITVTISSIPEIRENMPETVTNILLPEGFELVSGNPTWHGYIKNEPQQFNIKIKAVKIGNWTIEAKARSPPEGGARFVGDGNLYISVYEDKGVVYEDNSFKTTLRKCEYQKDSQCPINKETLRVVSRTLLVIFILLTIVVVIRKKRKKQ